MSRSLQKKREDGGRSLSGFARHLLEEWKRLRLPLGGALRVLVAVSGGADSTALLLALEELVREGRLTLEFIVAHLDHGLRGEAGAADARWVAELADRLCFKALVGYADVRERAALSRDNLEQAARRARYEFLAGAASESQARFVLTAHTMDDQAETMLLRLMRGSGAEGLSGIGKVRALAPDSEVLLVRPLLGWARRALTQEYCRARGIEVRVDSMNEDERYARVRVRRQLLPLMLSFNGRVVEALSRTAELLREDAFALGVFAERLLEEASAGASVEDVREPEGASPSGASTGEAGHEPWGGERASVFPPLRVDVLKSAPKGQRRRALRAWLARGRGDTRRLELVHLLAVEALLEGERGGRFALLPGGARVYRKRGWLYLLTKKVEKGAAPV